ncbi:MAG: hypothetical protein GDA51_00980 [Ekhidna sp.]|nr:hypothetical protein [Ekhidna sp.]MBC6410723.1 hypothetical protein [Ekhidna sp.]MBC6425055.1 hypothetical protein [Ekhidna sp.]
MKKFNVNIYYTGFCNYEVSAKNEEEAIQIARNLKIKKQKFFTTLESWQEADTVEDLKNEKSKI